MINLNRAKVVVYCLFTMTALAACSPEGGNQASSTTMGPEPAVAAGDGKPGAEDSTGALAGTSWRLVKIMEMDDSVSEPDDRSLYTLEFGDDGQASMLADCNRGSGSWTSGSPGQLQFGAIAATMAMCLPGSVSEQYLAQFQWVRSYVMKDGHLFLATMADGSIIEFEPAPASPLAATVLGEEIRTADAAEMQHAIITRLFDRYAAEQGIEALDTEIDTFVENMQRGMAADKSLAAENDLTAEEMVQVSAMRRDMARSIIRQWKINRALYEKWSGRIIYQQMGPEPLDAYREFFEERQKAGDFTINEPAFVDEFWRYFNDDAIHSFMEPGSADAVGAFKMPPWELQDDN